MLLCIKDEYKENITVIKLADVVSEEQGLVFLHSLDFETLNYASLCNDDGSVIYKIEF